VLAILFAMGASAAQAATTCTLYVDGTVGNDANSCTAPGIGSACRTIQAALNKAPRVSAAGFRAAVDALGTSFALLDTPATRFGPNRFTGPDAVRAMTFDRGCTCYKYTSGPLRVP